MLEPIDDAVVSEGATLIMRIRALDPNGFEPAMLVGGALGAGQAADLFTDFGDGTAELIYTPLAGEREGSPYTLIFRAVDRVASTLVAEETVVIQVVNAPPVLAPIRAMSTPVGQELSVALNLSDTDPIPPLVVLERGPVGATLDPSSYVLRWTPTAADAALNPHPLRVVAVDAVDSRLRTGRTAYVTVALSAPSLIEIPDQTAKEGEEFQVAASGTNAAGGEPTLSAIIFAASLVDGLEVHGASYSFTRASEATQRDASGKLARVPANTPRFDAGGRGFLPEGPRTNLLGTSINLGAAPWVANFDAVAIDGYATAPDGAQKVVRVVVEH